MCPPPHSCYTLHLLLLRVVKMATDIAWSVVVFSIILAVYCASAAEDTKIHNFMAKPSGQQATEEVDLGPVRCKFTYKCVGGTSEGWEMILEKTKSGYHCVIERPEQSSYLFFMMFEASIEGAKLVRAEPYDNSRRMLHENEYKVSGNKVKSQSAFKSNLATLALITEEK